MKKADAKKLEKFRGQLADMRELLDDMASGYRDKHDNASDKWRESEAGEECDTLINNLEQAAADIESAESAIQDILS